MDNLKRERTQLRRLFTKSLKKVENAVKTELVSKIELIPVFNILSDKAERLFEVGEKIRVKRIEMENIEEEFSNDLDIAENYRDQWIAMKTKADFVLATKEENSDTSGLRALETLRVTPEKYEAMLYPLVESALPEDLIKEWELTRSRVENKVKPNILGNLLEFLRSEVESDETLQLARSGFAKDQEFQRIIPKDPTAACIVSSEKKRAEKNDKQCIFCNKSFYNTTERFKAPDMSLEEKKETLKEKGACFICLKPGHNSKIFRAYLKCIICKKKPHINQTKQNPSPELHAKIHLSPRNSSTLLLTVLVKIMNKDRSLIIRRLFDTGAQRSFIKKDIVDKLGLEPVDQEMLRHGLFAGRNMCRKQN
ncbi:hypothetical protein HNY73_011174 [Argiope bruennichi]|uniref:Peptidase A2 domain-containing protein n=1 Tax=Argiope bruennichi TaxID=94029 RepID=A0A8T0F8A2_ARGBR|nr:hypothetical protein HNY73_011174 [Argiope bruennichi]